PVLASLGGGGFLHARPAGGEPVIYDFFVQTPRVKAGLDGLDFYPIIADFGDTVQEFHIGMGAIATPGALAGLFAVQQDLGRLSSSRLLEPARRLAERGVVVNAFQHRIATVVEPILRARPEIFALHAAPQAPTRLAGPGEQVPQPALAQALAQLADEGPQLLYGAAAGTGAGSICGAWGERLVADCAANGGHLTEADLAGYRVQQRSPLGCVYRDARLYLNPPPSLGGPLIRITLDLLSQQPLGDLCFGSSTHRHLLATAMRLTQELRTNRTVDNVNLDPTLLAQVRAQMRSATQFSRGTTQISIADAEGNLASMTLSNGEGAGYLLPGTGIMLNNMLGEEDLSPDGFHQWAEDQRIGSMMCPSLVQHADGGWSVLGSSGSNRIRSAILQVLSNLIDLRMPLTAAVEAPRIHYEAGRLNIEPPCDGELLDALREQWPDILAWSDRSIFFGGAHCVAIGPDGTLHGAGDSRRGGVVRSV
ncbi:MAG: gamma-glutamyltransferase, partial [Thiohalocapsa sp.]